MPFDHTIWLLAAAFLKRRKIHHVKNSKSKLFFRTII